MKEYRLDKKWRIFFYSIAPIFTILFGWLVPKENFGKELTTSISLTYSICFVIIILIILYVIEIYKGKVIIDDDKVISISTFFRRELRIEDINGYTIKENYICIEPTSKHKKRIKISTYFGNTEEIVVWLAERFPDLDDIALSEEIENILLDERIGLTEEIRLEKFTNARTLAKTINWAGGLSALWIVFYPTPYQLSMFVAMIIPIVALIVAKMSKGLIRVDERKRTIYPSVAYAIAGPAIAVMFRGGIDNDIFEYTNLWLFSSLLTVVLAGIVFIKQKEYTFKKWSSLGEAMGITVLLFLFSMGAVLHYNCSYDATPAEFHRSKILSTRVDSSNTTSYYFELAPWSTQTEPTEVSVSKELYARHTQGDNVHIYLRPGVLGIPWYIVTDE